MKDKLLYLTIGLLIGIVVMQWTMPVGQAADAIIGSGVIEVESDIVLDEYGVVWYLRTNNDDPRWERYSGGHYYPTELPVPVSQIKLWSAGTLITQDNVAWRVSDDSYLWVNCGPWTGGPVPTSPTTWGGVKGKYEGKK